MATLWASGNSGSAALMPTAPAHYVAIWGRSGFWIGGRVEPTESSVTSSSGSRGDEVTRYKVPVSNVATSYVQPKKRCAIRTLHSLEGVPCADDAHARASQVPALNRPGREQLSRIRPPECRGECRPRPLKLPCQANPRTRPCPSSAPFANDARAYDWFQSSRGDASRRKSLYPAGCS